MRLGLFFKIQVAEGPSVDPLVEEVESELQGALETAADLVVQITRIRSTGSVGLLRRFLDWNGRRCKAQMMVSGTQQYAKLHGVRVHTVLMPHVKQCR